MPAGVPSAFVPMAARSARSPAGSASHSSRVDIPVRGRSGGLASIVTDSVSRMSREDAPTCTVNSPASTSQRPSRADQKANSRGPRVNSTCPSAPGSRVSEPKPFSSRGGRATDACGSPR
jgi:hypothetical protein